MARFRREAAQGGEFAQGQRVMTIDQLPGRVLFVAASFSPGVTEYEVQLDNNMGQGTYTASQLRPLPADYRAGQRGSNLPAGISAISAYRVDNVQPADHPGCTGARTVWLTEGSAPRCSGCGHRIADPVSGLAPQQTRDMGAWQIAKEIPSREMAKRAAFMTTDEARQAWRDSPEARAGLSAEDVLRAQAAEIHTADMDYPEMGTVLDDRPDPGALIRIIGLRKAAYGPLDDTWDDQEVAMPWHDSPAEEPPRKYIHRGITVRLPPEVHAIVHDESLPEEKRGFALARHLLTHPHPSPQHGEGLGYNWTDSPHVAKENAERRGYIAEDETPVILHAIHPGREQLEDNPYLLRARDLRRPEEEQRTPLGQRDPWSYPSANEREISLRAGGTVPFHGVSWSSPGRWYMNGREPGEWGDAHYDPGYNHHYFEGLSAKANSAYGRPEDERGEDYNGGELEDTGMDWAEPAQQPWMHEHGLVQEEAPPPAYMPPVMARLAELEEAQRMIGMRHHATTINGTQIDDHGDAPGHGTTPRAADANSYDARSTEGDGDPKWSDAPPEDKRRNNGAEVGRFPEGISAGDGPGLEIGAVVAARHVPWTPHLRGELQRWDNGAGAGWGDWVNRMHFTNKSPVSSAEPGADEEIQAQAANQEGYDFDEEPGMPSREDELRAQGAWEGWQFGYGRDEPEEPHQREFDAADWHGAPGGKPERPGRPFYMREFGSDDEAMDADPNEHRSGEQGWFHHTLSARDPDPERFTPFTEPEHLQGYQREPASGAPEELLPFGLDDYAAVADDWEHQNLGNGWVHHTLSSHTASGDEDDPDDHEDELTGRFGPDIMEHYRGRVQPEKMPYANPANGGNLPGEPEDMLRSRPVRIAPLRENPDNPAAFRRLMNARDDQAADDQAEDQAAALGEGHPHDAEDDSLETGTPPDEWPLAGAATTEGGPAFTQGSNDGNRGRKFPPPPPSPAPADGTEPGKEDGNGSGKKISLEISASLGAFVAAAGSPAFRFEFTASWSDVVAKAKRIRKEGRVRITHASPGLVIGAVSGDHDVYETGIQRPPHKPQTIQHWACGCPWASFHQDKSLGTRYAGRPCSHVMALQFEAQARSMFGGQVKEDPGVPSQQVVVKSMPPWTPSGWSQTWLAPSASLRTAGYAIHASLVPFDQLQPHEQASVAQYHQQMIEEGNAQPGSTPHDYLYDSRQEPKADFLGRYMDADDDFKREYGPGDWEAHHQDTLDRHPIPSYPATGRWPLIVRDENPNYVDDGYHRMHSYIRDGATNIPTVRMYRTACTFCRDCGGDLADNGRCMDCGSLSKTATPDEARDWDLSPEEREERWPQLLASIPARQATAALIAAGEDLADIIALARLAGFTAELHPSTRMLERHLETAHYGDHQAAYAQGISPQDRHDRLHEMRAAVKIPHIHRDDQDDPDGGYPGLTSVSSITLTADQANAPWGSQNVSTHPPGKPYGATQPPDKDMDPGSYGPLAGPDPDNWGSIQEDSAYQMPLTNTASLPPHLAYPDISSWSPENQDSFGYSDRSNTAGPSTSLDPGDPNGIRMEESLDQEEPEQPGGALAELHDHPEPALPSTDGEHTAAADGTIGGGDAGSGAGTQDAAGVAGLGEFGASAMGDQARAEFPQAQSGATVGTSPGPGSADEYMTPDDSSIQTVGAADVSVNPEISASYPKIGSQQWSGGGADSDEVAVEPGDPQGSIDSIVAQFQATAGARQFAGGGDGSRGPGSLSAGSDIAKAAREYLTKTADVLPKAEADELINEGRGERARNLGLLRLEGTHYEDEADELAKRGLNLDDYDDDVISV